MKENKRLKSEADKQTLKQFKEDIFNKDISIKKTVKTYFKFTNDIRANNNIALRNDVCDMVSKTVRKLQNRKAEYEVGETLVCKKFWKMKNIKFNVNYEYEITFVLEKDLVITDKSMGIDTNFTVPIKMIKSNFIHGYCRTCHSFQGSSIDNEITIFDWDLFYTTRKWIYTAITRATDFKNVYFYNGKSTEINDQLLDKYLVQKINGYKQQDKNAKRAISKNYITKDWLRSCFGTNCRCSSVFTFEYMNGDLTSNLTADRQNNDEDHNLNNIVPMCITCNTSKSNKN